MKTFIPLLAIVPFAVAGVSVVEPDVTVTVTTTRTFTTCPVQTFDPCSDTTTTIKRPAGRTTTGPSVTSSSTTTSITESSSSSSTTTSSSPSPTTSTATETGKVTNPGTSFVPSAVIELANTPSSGQLGRRATTRQTVYIDKRSETGKLTTDASQAQSFVIDTTGTLSADVRSYPALCGGSSYQGAPGPFRCFTGGDIPYQTFHGWVNDPTFTYKTWGFCYTADLALYMSPTGSSADCVALTFGGNVPASAVVSV